MPVVQMHKGSLPLGTIQYKGLLYQAASWKIARRVVAKVEFHAGELFPRLLAYNLGNLWRRLGLPRGIENCVTTGFCWQEDI
jgi:hypothetical protein